MQAFEGIEPIKEGINPATWMLEQTGGNVERKIGKDFAELYEQSDIHKCAHCIGNMLPSRQLALANKCTNANPHGGAAWDITAQSSRLFVRHISHHTSFSGHD